MNDINKIIENIKIEFDLFELQYFTSVKKTIFFNTFQFLNCVKNNCDIACIFYKNKSEKLFYICVFKLVFYAANKIWLCAMKGKIDKDYNFYTKRFILSFIIIKSLLDYVKFDDKNFSKLEKYIENTRYINLIKNKAINFYYYVYYNKKYLMK